MSESPEESFGLGLDEPAQPAKAQPYRVLARKYRPQGFAELIGQDAMVRTLGNAIERDRLGHAAVHRLWQLLLKGLAEVQGAPMPLEAAEMAILRVIHASELPDPGALLERLSSGEAIPARAAGASPASSAAPAPQAAIPATFRDMVEALEAKGRRHLAQQLHDYARPIAYAPPELVLSLKGPIATRDLAAALKEVTGQSWQVRTEDEGGDPTLQEQEHSAKKAQEQSVLETPLVKAALEAFPGAELARYNLDEQRSA